MRLLQVIQQLRMGGAERVALALVEGAAAAGHDVSICATPGPLLDGLVVPHFGLPLLERRPWRLPAGAAAVRRAVRASGAELVHCHGPGVAMLAAPVTRRGRRPPGVVSFHGVADDEYPAAARILRLCGLPVVACGPGVAAALVEHGLRPLATIVNGVAPAPPPADRGALAAELGLPVRRLLVAVGRLVEQKNHALAIRALASVPDAALVIVGEGPLRGELERQAVASGVSDRVRFAGVRDDARAIMGCADAIVFPSRWEGLPLAALEALASGRPVVATAVRGLRELVADGSSGLLVPPGDAEALGAALRSVLDDAGLANAFGRAGEALAARYSEEAMVSRYLDVYAELVRR